VALVQYYDVHLDKFKIGKLSIYIFLGAGSYHEPLIDDDI
jgi:hypothetical protein